MSDVDEFWNLAFIDDFIGESDGDILLNMANVIREGVWFKYMYIYSEDVTVSKKNWTYPTPEDILTFEEGLDYLKQIHITDWTNIMLFQSYPRTWPTWKDGDPLEFIARSVTTIRACDVFFCVYTPYESVLWALQRNYPITSVQRGPIGKLTYCE